MSWTDSPAHRAWLAAEAERMVDFSAGAVVPDGFGWLDADGRVDADRPRELWITGRMTYVFALAHLWGRPGAGPLVDHGLAALRGPFADPEHGGWFAAVGPVDGGKSAYQHAFVVLAAAAGTLAGRPGAAALLDEALDTVNAHFWHDGLASDGWDRAWTAEDPYRGANANMHLTEAYLAAADATGDESLRRRALGIAERLIHGSARAHGWRLPEHYTPDWEPIPDYHRDKPNDQFRPYGVTPGHLLEWSRLLLSLRASLADPPGWLLDDARALFAAGVRDGWHPAIGGFVYTVDFDGTPVVEDRLHWVLAEAIGAAATLAAVTGEAGYEEWYRRCWDEAAARFVDRERGSWVHELAPDGSAGTGTWSGKPDTYHVVQATLVPRLPPAGSIAGALAAGHLRG
jgi:sulfoquinovose isomerase